MAKEIKYPVLHLGAKGDLVAQMQLLLQKWGSSVKPSGTFTIGTRTALLKFQAEKGLEIDGVCTQETWAELLKYANIKEVKPKEHGTGEKQLTLEEKVDILWNTVFPKK